MFVKVLVKTFVLLICCCYCDTHEQACDREPEEYILNFPRQDNPLNVEVVEPLSKNYIITLGDWGASTTHEDYDDDNVKIQQQVSKLLNDFYNSQNEKGFNLLFIITVGDNFYRTGVTDCSIDNGAKFKDSWKDVYGEALTSVPWLSVFGNHDWGDDDAYALCPWNNNKTKIRKEYIRENGKTETIHYGSNQLNKDKGGCNPNFYYLPDFSYYYSLNFNDLLNFELIQMETTGYACPGVIGGGFGNNKVFNQCGGIKTACNYMKKIGKASQNLLIERAKHSPNKNFLISQHYPGARSRQFASMFKSHRYKNGSIKSQERNEKVWSIFGHSHYQACLSKDKITKECNQILTGGGGGCCSPQFTLKGFYVIGFDDQGSMIQPYQFHDKEISCQYPCNTIQNSVLIYCMIGTVCLQLIAVCAYSFCCKIKDKLL